MRKILGQQTSFDTPFGVCPSPDTATGLTRRPSVSHDRAPVPLLRPGTGALRQKNSPPAITAGGEHCPVCLILQDVEHLVLIGDNASDVGGHVAGTVEAAGA